MSGKLMHFRNVHPKLFFNIQVQHQMTLKTSSPHPYTPTMTNDSASDGEVWDLESDVDETKKVRDTHYKYGYVDGITSAKDDNLQTGFNEVYPLGASIGLEVGSIIGELQMLVLLYGEKDESLRNDFNLAKETLKINSVLSKDNFDANFQSFDTKLIDEWRRITQEYATKYTA